MLYKKPPKVRVDPKENLSIKETINHCNIMAKVHEDSKNEDYETCERSIRSFEPKVVSLTSKKYRNSSFWDHVHGDDKAT
jgi:hypothetical protein